MDILDSPIYTLAAEPGEFATIDYLGDLEARAWSLAEPWLRAHMGEGFDVARTKPGCWLASHNDFVLADYIGWGETKLYRLTYEWFRGRVPAGYDLHHVCRVRGCFNPFHLVPLSREMHESWHQGLRSQLR